MRSQPGTRRDREPAALGGCSVGWLVAVNEPETRLALVRGNVESDPSAAGKLCVTPWAHQLAEVGVRFAFDQQLGDAPLESSQLGRAGFVVRACEEARHVIAHPVREGDGHPAISFPAHVSARVDAELRESFGAVLRTLSGTASNALGCECFGLLVSLACS